MAENVSLLSSPANHGQGYLNPKEYSSTQPTAPTVPPPPYADAAAQGQAVLPQYQPPGHVTGNVVTVVQATPQQTSPAYNNIDQSVDHFSSRRILRSYYMAVTLSFVWGFFCLPGLLLCAIPAVFLAKKSMQASSAGDTRAASQYSKVSIVCSVTSIIIGVIVQFMILYWGFSNFLRLVITSNSPPPSQPICPCPYDNTRCC